MLQKLNIILLGYADKISEAERKLEYYLNHDNLFESEIDEQLGIIDSYSNKINRLKFYLNNNNEGNSEQLSGDKGDSIES